MSIEFITLSSSAVAIASKLVPLLKQYLKARDDESPPLPRDAGIEYGGVVLAPSELQIEEKALEGLTLERVEQIEEHVKERQSRAHTSRVGLTRRTELDEFASAKEFGAFVLAISPQAVFQDARRRIGLVFKINLAVSIVLATILLGGVGGAVFSALFLKQAVWSLAFGGISVADIIGVYAFKPLSAINSALVGATRLDALQLRLSEQLSQCAQHQNLEERIHCQTVVWEAIQRELAIIAGVQSAN